MSIFDANSTILIGGNPSSLRWLYGDYENAIGSAVGDLIIGGVLNNIIQGGGGNDVLDGRAGNDTLTGGIGNDSLIGGDGTDTVVFTGPRSNYTVTWSATGPITVTSTAEGTDTLTGVEVLSFSDVSYAAQNNSAPTLSAVGTLLGGTEDTAGTITYATLAASADAFDAQGDAVSFRIEAVSSGTLTKGGVPVTPGSTTLSAGESLVWTPAANANGTLNAFTVKATDGSLVSSTAVQVRAQVTAVNDAPGGSVSLSGTPTQGQTLTVDTANLTDADGLGTLTVQWQADGTAIAGATGNTFTLTQAQVGKAIRAAVSYFDGGGTSEAVTTAATAAVANVNEAPTGAVTISGTATKDATLTAVTSGLADADGLGSFSYQWKANGVAISGATNATFQLTQAQVGQAITVTVSYTDGFGAAESVTSGATGNVTAANATPTGSVTISGTAAQGQTLTAANNVADADGIPTSGAGAISYEWRAGGAVIAGTSGSTYTLTQNEVGKTITVTARYVDLPGTAESLTSSATAAVANVNDNPSGAVTVSGTARQGETLTAANILADADGIPTSGTGVIAYQWLADGSPIAGATGNSLTLAKAQVGKTISVRASYTDNFGTAEAVTSTATAAVANVNDAPTGTVTVSGTARQGETLTAANTLADPDGIPTSGAGAITYQWLADGTPISGATVATFTPTQAQVGKPVAVRASYTDNAGNAESVTSGATAAVANVNDTPGGAVTVSGTARQGETLTAANTLSDVDGLGTISYQWRAEGQAIEAATGTTLVLTQAQVGKAITVTASYADGGGAVESVSSAASAAVENINDAPTGTLSIVGEARQGTTLVVANALDDADSIPTSGAGAVTYQWLADGVALQGATGPTLAVTRALLGKAISVKASYTDNFGKAESVTSAATATVVDPNDAPEGTVTISGMAKQGETLTAANTLEDVDGIPTSGPGAITYQWKANGTAIAGATASTYTLTQAEVGKTVTVTASYTDNGGNAEAVTSAATAAVANVNDAPTGTVTITGTAKQGETLTVASTLADADGIPASGTGAIAYQWLAEGTAITGATGATFTPTQAQVGKAITVKASYTDNFGTAESVSSAATSAVANVNDAPVVSGQVGAQRFDAGQPYALQLPAGLFSDVDGDALTLSASLGSGTALPAWLSFNSTAGSFSAQAGAAIAGEYAIRLSASDGSLKAETTFALTVTQNLPPQALSGRVQDGYVAGASIFIDRNGDGVAGADEDTGLRTDSQGNFNGTGFGQGAIIAVGGTNIDTGLRNTMTLMAPAGATVISPVTTLVQSIVKTQGVSVDQAQSKVATAFGLSSDVNLLTFDPLAQGATDAVAVSVQKVNVQVALTATLAGNTTQVVNAIARAVDQAVTSGGQVNLGSAATLETVTAGLEVSASTKTAIAQGNTQVATAASLQTIAQTQQTTVVSALPANTDWTAPMATGFNPTANAQNVARTASPVVTFSEAVQRGTGSITLKTASGATVEAFDAATSTRLSFNGSTLTVDPTADLAFGTTYVLEFQPGTVKDAAGNDYTGNVGSAAYRFTTLEAPDSTPPSMALFTNSGPLAAGQTALVNFTLSENSSNFTAEDVVVTGGTLSGFSGSGRTYTATFSPAANSTADGVISVASGTFTDAAGNANVDGAEANNRLVLAVNTVPVVVVDTTPPTIALSANSSLTSPARATDVVFVLSEPSADFTAADVVVTGGTLLGFAGSGTVYSAKLSPATGAATVALSVASGTFADAAGNRNTDGADANNRLSLAVDAVPPKVAVASDKAVLLAGQTARLSFTLSEAATDFIVEDVKVSGGTLSDFAGSGTAYTATFTPAPMVTTQASASVGSNALSDAAGNANADGAEADNAVGIAVRTASPLLRSATPADGAKSVAAGSDISMSFSTDVFAGKGAITLKTAAGETVQTFDPKAGDGSMTIFGTALLLNPKADLKAFTSYVVDFGADALEDAAGNDVVLAQPFDFRTTAPDGLYQFFVVAFDAAPGAVYMGQLAEAWNAGMSLQDIVEVFTQKEQFTSVFPTTMSTKDFAAKLVDRVVESSVGDTLKTSAAKDITDALESGWSRGKAIYTVFNNLAAKPTTDPDWGLTAQLLRNEVTVARYITEQLEYASTSTAQLQKLIDPVTATSDLSSTDKIVQLIGSLPPPGG